MTDTREDLIFLAGLQVGSELIEDDGSKRYVLELPDKDGTDHWHLTGYSDFCMCESWYEKEEMLERFKATGRVLPLAQIDPEERACECSDSRYVFGGEDEEGTYEGLTLGELMRADTQDIRMRSESLYELLKLHEAQRMRDHKAAEDNGEAEARPDATKEEREEWAREEVLANL